MRLGTTSYIYKAGVITNVRLLAGHTQDVELLFFELDDTWNSLPSEEDIDELAQLSSEYDLTYTAHLPLDLYLADDDPAIEKAITVIEATRKLKPHAFIIHLDSKYRDPNDDFKKWERNALKSLETLMGVVGDPSRICVENHDRQLPSIIDHILDLAPVSCCPDIGHLWKNRHNALKYLEQWLPRARVVHLHGVSGSDHKSLALVPSAQLDPIVDLLNRHFLGVVTLEVFNKADFLESVETFWNSLARLMRRTSKVDSFSAEAYQ
ncbi:MAG: cobamide remodeling phosphodiesterase CbiR [Pseudomonadota bacterium]